VRNRKTILLGLAVLAVGIGFLFLPIRAWFAALEGHVAGLGVIGPVVVALAYVALTVLLIPGSALTIGAGTFLYVYIGATAREALVGGAAGEPGTLQLALKIVGLLATFAVVLIVTRAARKAMAEAEQSVLQSGGALKVSGVR